MKPARFPLIIFPLLIIGCLSVGGSLWLLDRGLARPNAGLGIAALMGIFFITYTGALLLGLQWRDRRRFLQVAAQPPAPPRPDQAGTIYGLLPGRVYRVLQSFDDYYGNSFQKNERLHYQNRHFLPYEGGHTIVFAERALYLQEDRNREILDHFADYFALEDPAGR